jgi:proline dehydrogenase
MISTRPLLLRSSKQLSLWSSKLGYLRRHPSVASLRFKSTVSVSELEQDSVHVHEKGSGGPSKRPDFDDTRAAFSSKSTLELIRAHAVFSLCNISFLVRNADTLVRLSRKVFGDTITDFGLKHTLFALFCAGEDEVRIKPVLQGLRAHGIGGILDYAAESDSEPESLSKKNNISHQMATSLGTAPPYDYESEAACDRHVDVFLSCIQSVQHVAPDGFAAVKVTALGNPKLLERMSKAVVEAQQFFAKLDENGVSEEDMS